MGFLEYKTEYSHRLLEKFQQWREEGTHTDLTIISSDGKEFPVHKCVLAVSSDYMNALITGSFKERDQNVTTLKCIHSKVNFHEIICFAA